MSHPTGDLYACNHHHPIEPDEEEFVDFGTGRFVADKPMIPLLKALNELGLRTRTHSFSSGVAFVGILLDDHVRLEVHTVNELAADRDTFNGCRELLIMWKPSAAPNAPDLPEDVRRLVLAARTVAIEGDRTPETIKELDQASEAFASRVTWDDEPEGSADA